MSGHAIHLPFKLGQLVTDGTITGHYLCHAKSSKSASSLDKSIVAMTDGSTRETVSSLLRTTDVLPGFKPKYFHLGAYVVVDDVGHSMFGKCGQVRATANPISVMFHDACAAISYDRLRLATVYEANKFIAVQSPDSEKQFNPFAVGDAVDLSAHEWLQSCSYGIVLEVLPGIVSVQLAASIQSFDVADVAAATDITPDGVRAWWEDLDYFYPLQENEQTEESQESGQGGDSMSERFESVKAPATPHPTTGVVVVQPFFSRNPVRLGVQLDRPNDLLYATVDCGDGPEKVHRIRVRSADENEATFYHRELSRQREPSDESEERHSAAEESCESSSSESVGELGPQDNRPTTHAERLPTAEELIEITAHNYDDIYAEIAKSLREWDYHQQCSLHFNSAVSHCLRQDVFYKLRHTYDSLFVVSWVSDSDDSDARNTHNPPENAFLLSVGIDRRPSGRPNKRSRPADE